MSHAHKPVNPLGNGQGLLPNKATGHLLAALHIATTVLKDKPAGQTGLFGPYGTRGWDPDCTHPWGLAAKGS